MDIVKIAEKVKTKEDFVKFLQALQNDLLQNEDDWENPELGRYLEAMERFLDNTNEKSINKIDMTPTWSLFAKIMIAASIYE